MLRHLMGFTLVWVACAKAPPAEPEPPTSLDSSLAIAPLKGQNTQFICNFAADAPACLGMSVRWIGTVPEMVMSHPMVDEQGRTQQSYIEVDGQQYILLSAEAHGCSGKMEATGVLKEIDLGGPEGTRGSYRNYYLSDAEIRCLEGP